MKRIGAGLDHAIHSGAGMHSIRGVLRAGGEPEFLQCIGKRKRHACAVVVVDVRRPVQRILDAITVTAGDGYIHAGSRVSSTGARLNGHPRKRDEVGDVPAVQR